MVSNLTTRTLAPVAHLYPVAHLHHLHHLRTCTTCALEPAPAPDTIVLAHNYHSHQQLSSRKQWDSVAFSYIWGIPQLFDLF